MEFSNDFPNGTCVVWLSFQGFIQVSGIQAYPEFLVHRVSWAMRVTGINWKLLFHDYKAVDPFSHIFGLLKIPNASKFLISPWNDSYKYIGTFLGTCLAGFAFGLSWNL